MDGRGAPAAPAGLYGSTAGRTWPVEQEEARALAVCEVCGNEYRLAFEVHAQGAVHVFDSFECTVHRMAPVCEHCGVTVVGHGVEVGGRFFCCRTAPTPRAQPGSST